MQILVKGKSSYVPAYFHDMPLSNTRPIISSLTSASSAEDENLTGCTPALRRRRQSEKYVTDASQLNLQFQRPQHRTRPQSEVLPRLSPRGVPSHLLRESDKKSEESSESDSNSSGPPKSARQPPPPPTSLPPHIAENNARYDCYKYASLICIIHITGCLPLEKYGNPRIFRNFFYLKKIRKFL